MRITIIGSGIAGLSCGVHLANQGHQVQILEKNPLVGGRANRIDEKGYKIDMGPTLVLMPEILDGIFRGVGRNLSDYIRLKKLEPGYRVSFSDGKQFDMTTDMAKLAEQIRDFAPETAKRLPSYVRDVQAKLESSRGPFIERNLNSLTDMMSLESLVSFWKIKPWGSAYGHVYKYFQNDYLTACLTFQCLYLGQTPLKTPALYNLLAYLEFTHGIWYPMGGLHEIPKALAKVFQELGGTLRLGTEVESIHVEGGAAKGVRLKDGTLELSDVVVSNRDLPASYFHFVNEKDRPSVSNAKIKSGYKYGCSCMMLYLGLNRKLDGMLHHTIFLEKDIRKSSRMIFDEGRLPDEPLLYVCCPTRTDASLAPEGGEVLYVLAIVPSLQGKVDWSKDTAAFRKRVLERIAQGGFPITEDDIEVERVFTPKDFESTYGSFNGTAFGLAPDFLQSAAFRPKIKSKDVKGLYHVGASTHPGGGIPMTLTCGRIAAEQIAKDYRFAPVGV